MVDSSYFEGVYEMNIMEGIRHLASILFGYENLNILYALIVLVTLDYITGVCVAIKDRELSSTVGAKGISRKIVVFALIALSNIVDTYFLNSAGPLEAVTILFYCTNEAISILENACKMGVPVPQKLKDVLQLFKNKNSGQ